MVLREGETSCEDLGGRISANKKVGGSRGKKSDASEFGARFILKRLKTGSLKVQIGV